ncbi:MAG TPA: hypothetical protein VMT89_06905 [Candidatus Acidoferrales bacterium]|nr:hypothetical protein [Candidatus Acidoferrales bacterium]
MADPNAANFANEFQRRYTNFVNHAFDRFGVAMGEVRGRHYSPEKFVSDAWLGWTEFALAWCFPLELTLALMKGSPLPIRFEVRITDLSATELRDIPNDGVPKLTTNNPKHADDGTTVIPISAKIVEGGHVLMVRYAVNAPLKEGFYTGGEVWREDPKALLAQVSIHATPA